MILMIFFGEVLDGRLKQVKLATKTDIADFDEN